MRVHPQEGLLPAAAAGSEDDNGVGTASLLDSWTGGLLDGGGGLRLLRGALCLEEGDLDRRSNRDGFRGSGSVWSKRDRFRGASSDMTGIEVKAGKMQVFLFGREVKDS